MTETQNQPKALIAMSGGVDSSVAAWLMQQAGCECTGVTMRLTRNETLGQSGFHTCCSERDIEDAAEVAFAMDIPYEVVDFTADFREKIIEKFIRVYEAGGTPNPCIDCNKYMKFDHLLRWADAHGIDYVVTGHYARVEQDEATGRWLLKKGLDENKDQSYVLYNFTQEQLAHTLMPLGGYNKDWVRQKAEELGLGVAHKPDSQEICFVEDDDYAKFITDYSGYKPKEGDILDVNGNVIGKHRGLIYYTIGQRKGIGAYGRPMFVMKIDAENNTITLGEKGMEFSNELTAYDVNFVSGEFPKENMLITAKVRYQAPPAAAMLCPQKDGTVKLMFPEPQRAVTPGQAVVFYDGDIVLGGGTVL